MSASLYAGCRFLIPSIAGAGIVLITAVLIAVVRRRPWRNMLKLSGAESILSFLLAFNTRASVAPTLERFLYR